MRQIRTELNFRKYDTPEKRQERRARKQEAIESLVRLRRNPETGLMECFTGADALTAVPGTGS